METSEIHDLEKEKEKKRKKLVPSVMRQSAQLPGNSKVKAALAVCDYLQLAAAAAGGLRLDSTWQFGLTVPKFRRCTVGRLKAGLAVCCFCCPLHIHTYTYRYRTSYICIFVPWLRTLHAFWRSTECLSSHLTARRQPQRWAFCALALDRPGTVACKYAKVTRVSSEAGGRASHPAAASRWRRAGPSVDAEDQRVVVETAS